MDLQRPSSTTMASQKACASACTSACDPAFTPSPAFNTNAGASDRELNEHNKPEAVPRIDSTPYPSHSSRLTSPFPRSADSSVAAFDQIEEDLERQERSPRYNDEDLDDGNGGAVAEALHIIKAWWQDKLLPTQPSEWYTLHISPAQVEELFAQLESEHLDLFRYCGDKLRFDYDPDQGIMVLRLAETALHCVIEAAIVAEINWQIKLHSHNHPNQTFRNLLEDIYPSGHSSVFQSTSQPSKRPTLARKSPDGQFKFEITPKDGPKPPYVFEPKGTNTPGFILEVGFSQDAEALHRTAIRYLEKSRGPPPKSVLTVKLDYKDPQQRAKENNEGGLHFKAYYRLYRPSKYAAEDVVFCNGEGQLVEGNPIRLPITDFIPEIVFDQLSDTLQDQIKEFHVELSHEFLHNALKKAARAQVLEDIDSELSPNQSHDESDDGAGPSYQGPVTRPRTREATAKPPAGRVTRSKTRT